MARNFVFWSLLMLLAMPLACAKSSAIRDCNIDELHAALGQADTVLLDIRKGDDLTDAMVFIEGATQIPLHTLSNNLQKISQQKNVYILGGDYNETIKAANILADAGYPFIYRVQEGFDAYVNKYPPK